MRTVPLVKWMQCALLAALTGVFTWLSIPIDPVPINLATLAVFLAGGLLGAKYGAISQIIYLLLGVAGIPVFSKMRSGAGVLLGPTGGYIVGYIVAAWLVGLLAQRFGRKLKVLVPAMVAGAVCYYLLGTLWYIYSTGSGVLPALMMCVLPFLPGDAAKVAVAATLVRRLAPVLEKETAPIA